MTRPVRTAIVLFLIGAALAIAGAWGLAITVDPSRVQMGQVDQGLGGQTVVIVREDIGASIVNIDWNRAAGGGSMGSRTYAKLDPPRWVDEVPSEAAFQTAVKSTNRLVNERWTLAAFGWPFRCVMCDVEHEIWTFGAGAPQTPERRGALETGLPAFTASGRPRLLPTRILWPGLLANAAMFATVLAVPLVVRVVRRGRRGACLRCGYQLTVEERCPECGTAPI